MDSQQFEDISDEMQILQKLMKNVMEIVFATSPLLVLLSKFGGWPGLRGHGSCSPS